MRDLKAANLDEDEIRLLVAALSRAEDSWEFTLRDKIIIHDLLTSLMELR